MEKILLPYGKGQVPLEIEDGHLAGVLRSGIHGYRPPKGAVELVRESMENPIGSPRLRELAAGKRKITVIASDHTRPVPSRAIIPPMLEEIRAGNPDAEVTILVATGLHRTTTKDELAAKFGPDIVSKERIVVHDCDDAANLVSLGKLPSGGDLVVNRLAVEADLLVAEGFIEPHFFAGFSGGRKSVLPGIASRATVMYNHNAGFIAHPKARTGVLDGNPIHEDMLFAARAARLAFVVNVVIDAAHEPIFSVAGDCEAAHRAGREFLAGKCQVGAVPADIAVSTNGGYPLDQNIYQAVKGMTAAEATVKDGGVIVMFASASDGHGGASFHRTFRDEPDLGRMMRTFLARRPEETIIDQWQSQILARVLLKAKVVFVSECDDQIVRDLHMIPAHGPEEAMEKAKALVGRPDYTVTVIPDGVAVIVREDG
ncbi:MAG: nickel-dependent lactate racemase [Kiritimatiellae bacterium]|nr:nickel-dependent lactate racemase [Kiritimatiellia bacterium]